MLADLTLFDKTFEIFFDGKLIACNFSSKKDVERFLNHLHLPIRQPRPSGGAEELRPEGELAACAAAHALRSDTRRMQLRP
jgi:hypothetical protein